MFTRFTLIAAMLVAAPFVSAKPEKNITLEQLGSYDATPPAGFDEGAAEIVAYDPETWTLFVINASAGTVDLLSISDPTDPQLTGVLDVAVDIAANDIQIETENIGGVNSVAVHNGLVAVAVENDDSQLSGWVAFYDTAANYINHVMVGVLPDAVTITHNGNYVLTADEGQPEGDYLNFINDPEGTVSVIDLRNGAANATVSTADFTAFNGGVPLGVRTPLPSKVPGLPTSIAQDLEPEYIATSKDSTTAWVTLQENNALAIIDIPTATVTALVPLGAKDHSLAYNALDASNEDGPGGDPAINITTWPVQGLYMPDTIVAYQTRGRTYLMTANEGDAREYGYATDEVNCPHEEQLADGSYYEYDDGECIYFDEARIKDLSEDSPVFNDDPDLQDDENLGRLKAVSTEGVNPASQDNDVLYDALYSFGGRSFSIWDTNGTLVFDSGKIIEEKTAELFPEDFNSTNDENLTFDDRSDDKGPEPEALTVGKVQGQTYAFVGLERIGGVMIFDVTIPEQARYVDYINNRNFLAGDEGDVEDDVINPLGSTVGDLGPESFTFIKAEDSPIGEPLLVAGNEISGTTTIYLVIAY